MQNLAKIFYAGVFILSTFPLHAATLVTDQAWQWIGKTADFNNDGFVAIAWQVDGNISGSSVEAVESALAAEGINLDLTAIYKNDSGGASTGQLTSVGTAFQISGNGIEGTILKSGGQDAKTLVALFSESVDTFYYSTGWTSNDGNLSHYVFLAGDEFPTDETPPIPTPAAAFLFVPALMGMLGFRRKLNSL